MKAGQPTHTTCIHSHPHPALWSLTSWLWTNFPHPAILLLSLTDPSTVSFRRVFSLYVIIFWLVFHCFWTINYQEKWYQLHQRCLACALKPYQGWAVLWHTQSPCGLVWKNLGVPCFQKKQKKACNIVSRLSCEAEKKAFSSEMFMRGLGREIHHCRESSLYPAWESDWHLPSCKEFFLDFGALNLLPTAQATVHLGRKMQQFVLVQVA